MPIWEVTLYVDGPVNIKGKVIATQQKGFRVDDPFYSDVEIIGISSGLKATVTSRAKDHVLAYKAGVFFFGHMVDVLTLAINRPMYLSLTETGRSYVQRHDVKRIIVREEFESAFSEAHQLANDSPSFLRSLGWFRKGLTTDDPLDKFLAFWNSIEIVAGKYYQNVPSIDKERAKNGSISQVWECFQALWGHCNDWPVIPGQSSWIDQSYAIRVDVAHGAAPIDIRLVTKVTDRLPEIEELSYRFLLGWRERFLSLDRQPPTESLPIDGKDLLSE